MIPKITSFIRSCKNCDVSYVAQTSRQLKNRILEYKSHSMEYSFCYWL